MGENMSKITVSVVMPVYNAEKYLSQAIESILKQSFSDFEFIIVNDGSSDSSLQIIMKYAEIDDRIIILSRENRGIIYSLNEAIYLAKGNYIARMDADDIANEMRLQTQISYLEKENYDVVGSNIVYIDSDGVEIANKVFPESNKHIRKKIYYKCVISHPTVMYKKEVVLKSNCYMGGKASEDYDLWLRLMRNRLVKFYNVQENLLQYRIHNEQMKGDKSAFAEVAGYFLREALCLKSVKPLFGCFVYILKRICL
ncbi:glycosyltransferase like 2 family protein [Francisella philomiragia subsp. philomiragia ATCC 25015]|nr:glycosyltransferase like 2 family protein [Francisella philomiragia subsp. philomiragia ATCC 25015]EET21244.1 predicted protein [Francisella philomiragia subsp. philomiragia ATCC 25015]